MKLKEFGALIALAAIWGGSFLLIRVAVPTLGPMPLVAGRVIVAGLLLWIGYRALGHRFTGLRENLRPLLALGAVNAALPFTLIAAAELQLSASLASVLNATVPMFTALIGAVWLGQRIGIKRGLGLVVGVVGVGVLVGWSPMPMTRGTILSVVAMLVASASYGFAGIYTKRRLSGVPVPTLALGQQIGAATWLFVPALWQAPREPVAASALWALLGLAAMCTSLAYILYFYLIAQVGAVRTGSVTYLIPLFGMTWGALFLGESVTRGMLLGLGIVLLSVVLVNDVRVPESVGRWGRSLVAWRPGRAGSRVLPAAEVLQCQATDSC